MRIMLFPALIVIFLIGWCMYCIGDRKKPEKIQRKPIKKDNLRDDVTIMPIIYEEKQEIMNE
jgi:hypothetical protein